VDFTLKTYRHLLTALQNQGFVFQTFAGFLENPADKAIVLRHDVEKRYQNALAIARLQHARGIRGTYYFRILNGRFQRDIINEIASLGHEIGYHYDDLSHCQGDYDAAIRRFERHLAMLREIAPVKTICMEGAPLSNHNNLDLWNTYNYRDYGIIGEPYLDLDFSKILYLTDTGRRWDGDKVSVRDKVEGDVSRRRTQKKSQKNAEEENLCAPQRETSARFRVNQHPVFRHTKDIIAAADNRRLPSPLMITIHPQRWTDKPLPWLWELLWQNAKNVVKRIVVFYPEAGSC
jgi:hypothetical protein